MRTRMTTLGASLAAASMLGSLAMPGVAEASSKGRKNTAVGLGAAAAHQILTGKTSRGVLLGAGAAYAYKRYKDSEREENRTRRTAEIRNRTYRSRTANGGATAYTRASNSRTRAGAASPASGRLYNETKNTYVPNGSYYFTGKLADDATELTNRSITVDHNGVRRRVFVPKSATVVQAGQRMSMHDLRRGDMVRVLAARSASDDRWNASRVELISSVDADTAVSNRDRFGDPIVREGGTATYRDDASTRYSGTGIVESVASDNRSFTVRVGTNVRRVYVDGASFQGVGDLSDIRAGDRVRITGTLDGREVNAQDIVLVE